MNVKSVIGGCAIALTLSMVSAGAAPSKVADAVMNGDKAAVRSLIAAKADVNAPQVDGATALHWAVYRDDLETADLLIRSGAKVSVANREGVTPLAMASLYGNIALINRLLTAGADAKERGPNGETVLMLAARNGNPDAVKTLLAHGADVNVKEKIRETTALMWAVEQGHTDAVKALIAGGADLSAKSGGAGVPRPYGAAPVGSPTGGAGDQGARGAAGGVAGAATGDTAAAAGAPAGRGNGNRGGARGGNGGRGGFGGGGQAGQGAQAGNRGAGRGAQAALPGADDAAAPPEGDDAEGPVAGARGAGGGGLTALVFAARQGNIDTVRALLDAKANVNQVTEYNWSPLLVATENRHYELAKVLIDRGADVNAATKDGWTSLYLATDNRNIEGGDYPVPKPDIDHLEYIKFLLEHGANPNARVAEGNPKSHSTLTRTIFTMQWFFEEGATPLVRAAQSGDVALIQLLLAHGADPKIRTSFGDTALTAAAGIGWVEGVTREQSPEESIETVKLLLDLGLDVNAANLDGRTPLMASAHKGNPEVVRLLVARGAKLDTRDHGSRDTHNVDISGHGGWQALDYADGLVRVGVQSALAHPEISKLLRDMMTSAGLPVPPLDRTLGYVCAVEGPLCKNAGK
jgi:ankyrin repeat protein